MSTLSVLLKESWSYVEERADDLVNDLYARLFLAEPRLRDLFPVDMANQRTRMIGALVAMIQTVDDPDRFGGLLRALSRDETVATQMLNTAVAEAANPPFWHAEVVTHERRRADIAVLTCQPLVRYPFRAGQYAHLECAALPREWRPYSIANAPRADGSLEFHVRAPGAGVSDAVGIAP